MRDLCYISLADLVGTQDDPYALENIIPSDLIERTRAQAEIAQRRWMQQLDGHLEQNDRLRAQLESSRINRELCLSLSFQCGQKRVITFKVRIIVKTSSYLLHAVYFIRDGL